MTKCTPLERKLLDLIRGQPDKPTESDSKEIVELMNKIRFGDDPDYLKLLI